MLLFPQLWHMKYYDLPEFVMVTINKALDIHKGRTKEISSNEA